MPGPAAIGDEQIRECIEAHQLKVLAERAAIYTGNALRVYPRLRARLGDRAAPV